MNGKEKLRNSKQNKNNSNSNNNNNNTNLGGNNFENQKNWKYRQLSNYVGSSDIYDSTEFEFSDGETEKDDDKFSFFYYQGENDMENGKTTSGNDDSTHLLSHSTKRYLRKLNQILTEIELGIFGLLYLMTRDKLNLFKGNKGIIIVLLEFLMFLSFCFSSDFPWPLKLSSFQTGINVLSLTTTQLGATTMYAIFVVVISIILMMIILSVRIAIQSQNQGTKQNMWEMKLQRALVGTGISIFYIPFLKVLISPLECAKASTGVHSGLYVLRSYPTVECFAGSHWFFFIASVILCLCYIPFSILMSLLYYEPQPMSGDYLARPLNRVDFIYTLWRTVLVFISWVAHYSIPTRVAFLFLSSSSLLVIYFIFPPYYRLSLNCLRCALFAVSGFCTLNLIALVAVTSSSSSNGNHHSNATATTAATGITIFFFVSSPFVFVLAYFGTRYRLRSQYRGTIVNESSQVEVNRDRNKNRNQDDSSVIEIINSIHNPYFVEMQTRFLTENEITQERVDYARRIYQHAFTKFPNSLYLSCMYGLFVMTFDSANAIAEVSRLIIEIRNNTKSQRMMIDIRFLQYYLEKYLQQESEMKKQGHSSLGILDYVYMRRHVHLTKIYHFQSLFSAMKFWEHVFACQLESLSSPSTSTSSSSLSSIQNLGSKIDVDLLSLLAKEFEIAVSKSMQSYETLVTRYPDNQEILRSMGTFLLQVSRENRTAQECFKFADLLEDFQSRVKKAATIVVNPLGIVLSWDSKAAELFGWAAEEAIGQNIKFIVPEPHNSRHDGYLEKFNKTRQFTVMGKIRTVTAVKKSGESVSVQLDLSLNGVDDTIMAMVRESNNGISVEEETEKFLEEAEDSTDPIMAADTYGKIIFVNDNGAKLFGYRSVEMIGKNVKIIIPEPHRSNHHLYLRRFRETDQRIIVGKVRNLNAVRKNSSILAVSVRINVLPDNTLIATFADGWGLLTSSVASPTTSMASPNQKSRVFSKSRSNYYSSPGKDDASEISQITKSNAKITSQSNHLQSPSIEIQMASLPGSVPSPVMQNLVNDNNNSAISGIVPSQIIKSVEIIDNVMQQQPQQPQQQQQQQLLLQPSNASEQGNGKKYQRSFSGSQSDFGGSKSNYSVNAKSKKLVSVKSAEFTTAIINEQAKHKYNHNIDSRIIQKSISVRRFTMLLWTFMICLGLVYTVMFIVYICYAVDVQGSQKLLAVGLQAGTVAESLNLLLNFQRYFVWDSNLNVNISSNTGNLDLNSNILLSKMQELIKISNPLPLVHKQIMSPSLFVTEFVRLDNPLAANTNENSSSYTINNIVSEVTKVSAWQSVLLYIFNINELVSSNKNSTNFTNEEFLSMETIPESAVFVFQNCYNITKEINKIEKLVLENVPAYDNNYSQITYIIAGLWGVLLIILAIVWVYIFRKVQEETTAYRFLNRLPTDFTYTNIQDISESLKILEQSYGSKKLRVKEYRTHLDVITVGHEATSSSGRMFVASHSSFRISILIINFVVIIVFGILFMSSLDGLSTNYFAWREINQLRFLFRQSVSMVFECFDPLATDVELKVNMVATMVLLDQLRQTFVSSSQISFQYQPLYNLGFVSCPSPSEFPRIYESNNGHFPNLGDPMAAFQGFSLEQLQTPTPAITTSLENYINAARDMIESATAERNSNPSKNSRDIQYLVNLVIGSGLDACLIASNQYIGTTDETASTFSFKIVPILFWILTLFNIGIYYKFIHQGFLHDTVESSSLCQRMFKQIPLIIVNEVPEIKSYMIRSGLMRGQQSIKDSLNKAQLQKNANDDEFVGDSVSVNGDNNEGENDDGEGEGDDDDDDEDSISYAESDKSFGYGDLGDKEIDFFSDVNSDKEKEISLLAEQKKSQHKDDQTIKKSSKAALKESHKRKSKKPPQSTNLNAASKLTKSKSKSIVPKGNGNSNHKAKNDYNGKNNQDS